MVRLPLAFRKDDEFRAAVDRVAQSLAPDVERIITELEYDWDDEPVAWLFVIVSDEVAARGRVREVMNKVRQLVDEQIDPLNNWEIFAATRVRTHTEQAEIERRNVA
jgi:hypothetical protein